MFIFKRTIKIARDDLCRLDRLTLPDGSKFVKHVGVPLMFLDTIEAYINEIFTWFESEVDDNTYRECRDCMNRLDVYEKYLMMIIQFIADKCKEYEELEKNNPVQELFDVCKKPLPACEVPLTTPEEEIDAALADQSD
jgi:hypothetical protein